MGGIRGRLALTLASLGLFAVPLLVADDIVYAGTGLNQYEWNAPGITLSSSSYKYSNMTGFWQAVVNSNQCPLAVDGIFGNYTTWYTAVFQNAIVGSNNGGVMTPSWLYSIQHATSVYGDRLVNLSFTDGYGTQHFGYYAGIESDATRLGWNPISAQWLFSQTPFSNPAALIPATPNRTISSVAACQ